MLSAVLYEEYGFRTTQDIVGLTAIVYGLLYFFCAGGFEAVGNTCGAKVEVDPYEEEKLLSIKAQSLHYSRTRSPRLSFSKERTKAEDLFPTEN